MSESSAEKGLPCDGWDSCPNPEHEHRVERDLWWGYLWRYLADTPLETSKGDDLERRDLSIGSAECSCAMTEGSQRRCPAHGEDAYVLPPGKPESPAQPSEDD